MSRFTINIYSNNSAQTHIAEIGAIAERLKTSTVCPGGCASASWRVPHPALQKPVWAGINYRVDILDEEGIFWAGRMEDFATISNPGEGDFWEIGCYGFGVSGDDQLYTTADASGLSTDTIVSTIISSLMPQIGATSIDATSVTLSGATAITIRMKKAGQTIGWASLFGDSSNNSQIWYVYPDYDRTIRATFTDRPTTVAIYLSLRQLESYRFGLQARHLANRFSLQYNGASSNVTVNDTTLQAAGPEGWNFIKERMAISDEITQSADATQLANALLTKYKNARMYATALKCTPDAIPLDGSFNPIPLWRVRSGQLAQLTDVMVTDKPNDQLSFNNSFLIVGTEYDEESNSLTITPESFESMLQMDTARARQLLEGRHTIHT